ncbi:MAG TPA: CDP-alcohol phosphatidyltransferase family protein [Acidimicrobiales bacterium]|nr:CDP-alcohol phosphatidyltransferase family protein [Acidimicrobiales bacterium]
MATGFGPSALATPANAITVARLLATPFVFAAVLAGAPSWWTLVLWILVAASDGLDGWLARRQGSTRSGAFLDPLSDKVLVLAALAALVARSLFWWLPVALIALREVLVSIWRSQAGRRGVSVPARQWAKAKTIVQEVAVGFALLPLANGLTVGKVVLWASVALTLLTGLDYFRSPVSA